VSEKNDKKSLLKRISLYFLDIFFYYGSNIFIPFGFLLLFVFILGRDREDFMAYGFEKKWWLISALSLLVAGFIMKRQSRFYREEKLKREVGHMFRKARKNARKK